MPNLLPDWLPWIQPAGRLIWSTLFLIAGLVFVFALTKPPLLKRPFPDRVGYALFAVIPIVGWIVAVIIPDTANLWDWELDAIIVDLVLLALFLHGLAMVVSRKPTPPGHKASWAACYLGAVASFALMTLAYAVVPHEWMTFANSYLRMGDTSHFLLQRGQWYEATWFGQGVHLPPFAVDMPALRDIIVSAIYGALLGLNLFLFVKWQDRNKVVEKPTTDETAPAKRSRFGRPLRRASASPAPEGA